LAYSVEKSTDHELSVYIKCPSSGSVYWAETAYKLGYNDAANFDSDPGSWTMIKKFSDSGTNGNGNTWTKYTVNFNSGSSSQVTIAFKLGSTGISPTVAWDTLRITPTAATPDITSDLVAHWKLDETSGTVATDSSIVGATHDGNVNGSPVWVPSDGAIDGALDFRNAGDEIDVPNHAELNTGTITDRTVAFWFAVDDATLSTRQCIFEEGGGSRGLNIYVESGSIYVGGWNNVSTESNWAGTWISTTGVSSGTWHHVALTLSGGTTVTTDAIKGYLDGVEFASGDGSQLWPHGGDITIGRNGSTLYPSGSGSAGQDFGGLLDDGRIYNRALSDIDIAELASLKTGSDPSPTIALSTSTLSPQCDEGSNAPADDFTVSNSGLAMLSYSVSDNQGWLSVSPTSGTSTGEADTITVTYSTSGLSAGTHNATITVSDANATNNPQTIAVTLTVNSLTPTIALSPTSLSPSTNEGSSPANDTFTVQNTGDGTLSYSISDNASWLSCSPTSGTSTGEADTITASYSTAGLAPDTYNATITVSDPNATNNPQTIAVSLTVNALPATITLNPTSLSPSADEGSSPANDTFTVQNTGGSTTLNYSISDNVSWLSCSPSSGTSNGEADTITVTYSTAGLAPDTYNATITVSDPNATNTPQTIAVSLTVNALPATITLNPTSLSPTCDEGTNATADIFTVQNTGGSTTLNYSISDNVSWLSCSPTSGTSNGEADTITVTYSTSGLSAGTHNATITVSDPAATNNPQTVAVTLTVNAVAITVAEDFETMPSWSDSYNASWGSAASWSIVGGGQSGNALQAGRSSGGSSVKTSVYTISPNTNYTISVYMRCPSYGGTYWAECAFKLGNNAAQNFDSDPNSWTMIQKFSDGGTNGNGDVWTEYWINFNSGSNSQMTVGYKLGSWGGGGPNVRWDTLRVE
jgi:hypothetical protein